MTYDHWKLCAPGDGANDDESPDDSAPPGTCTNCAKRPSAPGSDLCAPCLDAWHTGGH